jgi:dienelactone hydrolase
MFFEGLALVFCFVIAGFAQAPAPTSAISGTERDVNNPTNQERAQVAAYLDAIAAQDLAKRRSAIALITNRQAAEARQEVVRKKILSLIGGLPERTALNARTMGTVQGDGFHIEKFLFETQPQFYVTALLYIPDGRPAATRFPAILMSPGHYPTGKAADYASAADFARNGFVVLSYDPIGLGERLQYPDPHKPNASLAIRPTGEHGEAGLQPTLIGDAVSRYFVWDAIRGIDFLAQRPEVDPKHIGAFGCSGGGTISAMVGALDARVAAVGVACYNTSFDALLASIGPQDGEQSIPGFVAARLDFPDWIELVAPRPYAVIATYLDIFPFSGAVATVSEARRFYSLFDPSSAGLPTGRSVEIQPTGPALNIDTANAVPLTAPFQFITGPGHHAAIGPIMGDIIAFFMRNLQPGVDASHPVLLPASNGGPNGLPKDALQVTATGQVSTSFPGCATIFTLNHQRAERIAPPLGTVSGGELVSVVRAVTGASAIPGDAKQSKELMRS